MKVAATGDEGMGPFEGERLSTPSIDDKLRAVKPLLEDEKRKEDISQVTCCCFDVFKNKQRTSTSKKTLGAATSAAARSECEDRKRGFLYWFVTILAL